MKVHIKLYTKFEKSDRKVECGGSASETYLLNGRKDGGGGRLTWVGKGSFTGNGGREQLISLFQANLRKLG